MNTPSTDLREHPRQPFLLVKVKARPTEGMGLSQGQQQAEGQVEVRPLLPPRKGRKGRTFSQQLWGEREAAAGRNGPEKRPLWGSSEHP